MKINNKNGMIKRALLQQAFNSPRIKSQVKALTDRSIIPKMKHIIKPIKKRYRNSSSLDKQTLISDKPFQINSTNINIIELSSPRAKEKNINNEVEISPNNIKLDFSFKSSNIQKEISTLNEKITNIILSGNSQPQSNKTILACLSNNSSEKSNCNSNKRVNESVKEKRTKLEKTYISRLDKLGTYTTTASYKKNKERNYKEVQFILNKHTLLVFPNPSLPKPLPYSTYLPGRENNKLITFDIEPWDFPFKAANINMLYSPLCFLNFEQITCHIAINAIKTQMIIYVLGNSNQYFKFKFSNQDILTKFAYFTNYAMNRSLGSLTNIIGVSLRENFERSYFQSESDFISQVKSGDCLLFKGYECPSTSQRLCTGDEYDHVALLYKKKGVLYVYESTSLDGARVRKWYEFGLFNWTLLYEKIAYRKLFIDLDKEEKEKKQKEIERLCETFISQTRGKKYKLNLCTLLCGGKVNENEKNNKWIKSKGFFCSQLVIAAYMNCGIIPCNKNSASFLPGHFSQNKILQLNENLYLSPEVIIEFSL